MLDSKQRIAVGGVLATLGGVGMVFSILFGSSLLSNLVWVVSLFLVGVAAGLGAILVLFGLYERRQGI
jgi:UDP-N-acetylmuramyl pentapeptide phosphotransferase/UDP-N-acetylglucosamine-1-phosphate transferase